VLGLLAPIILAISVAFLFGASPARWSQQRVRWAPLAVGAMFIQIVLFSPILDEQPWIVAWGAWLWVATMAGVLTMLLRNLQTTRRSLRAAWAIAALGVAANILVVTVNGGHMPRTVPMAPAETTEQLSNVFVASSETPLLWLGDVIAEPDWLPLSNALSIGDILLAVGLASWVLVAGVSRQHVLPA